MIQQALIIGYGVIALTALIGLFAALYKPLSDNTKAMTKLIMNIEQLAKKIEEQNKRIDEQERELNNYKDHMRESQKRQWEVLDKHEKEIIETNHNLELCRQRNQKGGNKDV